MSAVEAVTRTNTSLLPHIKTWESLRFLQKALLLSALDLISFEWLSFRKYLEIFERLMFVDRCISEGTIIDNGQLICLYLLVIEIVKLIRFFHHLFYTIQNIYICQARLLERELSKCFCLVSSLPMQDMDKHFGRNQLLQNIIPPSTL